MSLCRYNQVLYNTVIICFVPLLSQGFDASMKRGVLCLFMLTDHHEPPSNPTLNIHALPRGLVNLSAFLLDYISEVKPIKSYSTSSNSFKSKLCINVEELMFEGVAPAWWGARGGRPGSTFDPWCTDGWSAQTVVKMLKMRLTESSCIFHLLLLLLPGRPVSGTMYTICQALPRPNVPHLVSLEYSW